MVITEFSLRNSLFKDFSLDLAQQEGSRDFRIQKRGRRLYRLAGACELSHLPMRFLALFPNGIERQIWRQSLRVHNTVQNSRFARPERANGTYLWCATCFPAHGSQKRDPRTLFIGGKKRRTFPPPQRAVRREQIRGSNLSPGLTKDPRPKSPPRRLIPETPP